MALRICWNEEEIEVELTGGRKFRIGDEDADCVQLPDGRYSIILGGRVFDVYAELRDGTCVVHDASGRRSLRIIDPRRLHLGTPVEEGQAGLQRIVADMPGKVIRLLVAPGDRVAYGQGVLVLEAMKMQNEIRSPKSGIVKEVAVQSGRAVSTGDFLLSLE